MTTISIPPHIEPVSSPEGTPWGADAFAATLLSNAARITEFSEEATLLASPPSLWMGSASSAYSSHASRFAKKHEPMGETLKRVARGVDSFADELRTLRSEHTDLTNSIRSYHGHRSDLVADVNAATDADDAEVEALRERSRYLHRVHSGIVTDIATFGQRVAANEDYLVQLFTSADTVAEASASNGGITALALAAISAKPSVADGPDAMAEWWNDLTESEQDALIAAYPAQLGGADGLPAWARDRANRLLLQYDLVDLTAQEAAGTLTDQERTRLENARAAATGLATADSYEDPITGEKPGGMLWLYDPDAFDGDGRVAIAVGDLDTADDVSLQIPGIRSEMTSTPGYVQDAVNLHEAARFGGDGSTVATMFWLGYDTPAGDLLEWAEVPSENYAAEGGARLAAAVDGLRASRAGDPAHMTAIGHSYGSTTTAYAATNHDLAVDDIALIGSPGTGPATHASDFSVGADNVYVGRNSHDFVATLGDEGWVGKDWFFDAGLGVDPSSEDFGANRFEAEAIDRQTDPVLNRDGVQKTVNGEPQVHPRYNLEDHSKYFVWDSESLYNLGRIVDGQGDDINVAEQSYDPWWSLAVDPEQERTPTSDIPGRSDTGADR